MNMLIVAAACGVGCAPTPGAAIPGAPGTPATKGPVNDDFIRGACYAMDAINKIGAWPGVARLQIGGQPINCPENKQTHD